MRLNWHSLHDLAIDTATCDEHEMDKALSRYLQHLFERTAGLALRPRTSRGCRGHLPISWRAFRAWTNFGPGQCRKPWPPQLVLAMIALARLLDEDAVALCLALMFHCF
jgi:hypothetical protein